MGKVVGRRDICDVIQDDLRDRDRRRPHVIVGGVGIGKTAVLVELTRLLARRGAIPVPVRLRDASEELDFLALARRRFLQVAGERLLSEAEGERVWRQLRKEDRIVVLADGLEEALLEAAGEDRDHRIRAAVSKARAAQIPLVIATRPHDAVNALDAAVVRLEPLSAEAGREYIEEVSPGTEDQRLNWIIATADVVETPLYLQITRNLHAQGLLEHDYLEMRNVDRIALRSRLMKTWLTALTGGELPEEDPVPLDRRQREATAWYASGLACVALISDSLQVSFNEYFQQKGICDAVENEIEHLPGDQPLLIDVKIAASNAVRIGLLEHVQDGVRFPHSIMQAYLGSRLIGEALREKKYLETGLQSASRELLVALVMYSRDPAADLSYDEKPLSESDAMTRRQRLRNRLGDVAEAGRSDAAHPLSHPKRLDVLCAAIEIDAVSGANVKTESPDLGRLAENAVTLWKEAKREDDETQDAKFKLVAALGESARRLGARAKRAGRASFDQTTARVVEELEPKATDPPPPAGDLQGETESAYSGLYRLCCAENLYRIRLEAAQELGAGGDAAFEALKKLEIDTATDKAVSGPISDPPQKQVRWPSVLQDAAEERRLTLRGWLLPMLVDSVGDTGVSRPKVRDRLDSWLQRVRPQDGQPMPLALEAAFAQGFKHAANRRPIHPNQNAETRAFLVSRATEMLRNAQFWYSRLTLLHALCLWKLSQERDATEGSDYVREVKHWLHHREGSDEHPFVGHAADLVVEAMRSGRPDRYLWIDESGVVMKVGSSSHSDDIHRRQLWLPSSTGWIALDRRAQQLLADVLVLLRLAERGVTVDREGVPERTVARDRQQRLKQVNCSELPPCITDHRAEHLRPKRTVGSAERAAPGSACREGCPVDLCPYPSRGEQPYRVELSEAFCRQQRAILRLHALAPWQDASARELKRFWTEMEERARR